MKTRLALLTTLFLPAVLLAQDTRGTINGRVADPSGAVVPGASITVSNPATGLKSVATTNQDGYYQAPLLPPGLYKIEAVAQGFKTAVRDKVEVRVADRIE